ncbi:MAG: DUF4954 family protein [Rikenellaceae bacterium]
MYRKLTIDEVATLQGRGCHSKDWRLIQVKRDSAKGFFDAYRYKNVLFSGRVRLGYISGRIDLSDSISVPCSIRNVHIFNSTIGDNVYINHVSRQISNYTIAEGVVIDSVGSIDANSGSTFGNNTQVTTINEGGGREVAIFNELSAQIAYIFALYRHNQPLISALYDMVDRYSQNIAARGAQISRGAKIIDCKTIEDVNIGEFATVSGVLRLCNGSINSSKIAPTYVGEGVIADHFILAQGATVKDGAIVDKCFVGEAVEIGKQFSAENSLFFANSVAMHGEACSAFAGPYTVTHHKSTLLIAALYSFMNAGSGLNQSNHMYKLGAIHQGILERGVKTASGAYMLFPMRVGAFSLVMGRHYSNSDLSDFPFSYIIENKRGETEIIPAVNLKTIGTRRDSEKWQERDKRANKNRLDLINFELLNPYIVKKMVDSEHLFQKMIEYNCFTDDESRCNGALISKKSTHRAIEIYGDGILKYLGEKLQKRLEGVDLHDTKQIVERLTPNSTEELGKWVDIAGQIAPKCKVDDICDDIASGFVNSLEGINSRFRDILDHYEQYEWCFVVSLLQKRLEKRIEDITSQDILEFITKYQQCCVKFEKAIEADAKKEFSATARIGYGIDSQSEQKADFLAVRG